MPQTLEISQDCQNQVEPEGNGVDGDRSGAHGDTDLSVPSFHRIMFS
jgi:hypothetical protein